MEQQVMDFINENIFGIWFLIGAALVFWMQAGFAMVETGFTRAKNAGNIIMKNLMDFCIGTVVFILIGFSFLLGEDFLGFIGKPGFDIFTAYSNFDFSNFVFNLVFCATTATIVSGAMAERTKFLSYCILHLSTRSRHTGSGAAAGYHSLASMISQVPVQFIWLVVFQPSSELQCLDLVSVNLQETKQERSRKLTPFLDITFQSEHLVYLSSGLDGMDLTVPHVKQDRSLQAFSLQQL